MKQLLKDKWLIAWLGLLIIACALLCFPEVWAFQLTGSGISSEASPSCSTQTEIISIADDGNGRDLATYTMGQSFAGNDKGLYSISVFKKGSNAGTIRVRIGTSANLSSTYTEEITITVSAAEAFYEGLSATNPTLTSGTWYIMCINGTSTHSLGITDANPYAGGIYYYGTGGTFNGDLNVSGRDLAIKVKTCD